ncbi:MAG: hypothetical protein WEA28_07285 [Xanthobacteraceae bacterium]
MSLLLAYFSARKRNFDLPPPADPKAKLAETGARKISSRNIDWSDRVFSLIPPGLFESIDSTDSPERAETAAADKPPAAASSRNIHPIGIADLSRLSIDNDGRLYWDGKPVEVRRRILMSRAQVIGAGVIGAFVAIGAIGAAIQGSAAVRDWACRLGWTTNYCTLPDARPALHPRDIPA